MSFKILNITSERLQNNKITGSILFEKNGQIINIDLKSNNISFKSIEELESIIEVYIMNNENLLLTQNSYRDIEEASF